MKVCHLIEGLGSGGAERLLYTNLKYLNPDVISSEVITVFPQDEHWKNPIQELGVPVRSLECESKKDIPKAIVRLTKMLRESKPDLLHTHLWTANIIGRISGYLAKVPVLSSIHNPDYEVEALTDGSQISASKNFIIRNLDRWTARLFCREMIAVSEYVKHSTHKRLSFPEEKIKSLYNPVDVRAFQTEFGIDRKAFLTSFGIPEQAIVLLNVARISPQKGFLYAVQALPQIKAKFPNAHLVSVGAMNDKNWLGKIENEIDRLNLGDSVHFLGAQKDVVKFLQTCDLFLFPSLHEGLGIALIEAMVCGCACIASRTGPIPEFITHEVNGLLVPPRNPKSLAESVCELLADEEKRKSLGAAAREMVLTRFSPQPAADKLAQIYLSTV